MTTPPLTSGILVIFGITGDLVRKKLLPALYYLAGENLLPEQFEIVGLTRRGTRVEDLLDGLQQELRERGEPADHGTFKRLGSIMRVVTMDMTRAQSFADLKATLDGIETERGTCLNRLFYLSIPPHTYGPVIDFMGDSKLGSGCQHGTADSRIMVEKPFGYDLESAQELITRIKRSFTERQIYRIDHYLAKETAQNILTFRQSNPLFQAVWGSRHISHIVVNAAEAIGIEGRASFYEPTGALRDLIQSHLLQVLTLVTMELPDKPTSANVHQEKLKLLQSIKPIKPNEVATRTVRGQYKGYRDEAENPDSITETFARIEVEIDNDRWRGVPVLVQAGKRLARKDTSIAIGFGDPAARHNIANTLVFRLQPDEGISIDLVAKKPGFNDDAERVEMTFDYHNAFGEGIHPDAYERVLMDGIRGDQTLFATSDEVLASWRIVDSIVHEWAKGGDDLIIYEPGLAPA
ncbi:MAG: glucose-6-phosphate 1-dehydrogenase [Candidatus Saccharibacteria bacterium]|nr:glucose-6-phosphate 1-dehydrogenase [Candidatus Saccharibacteria bacterium]